MKKPKKKILLGMALLTGFSVAACGIYGSPPAEDSSIESVQGSESHAAYSPTPTSVDSTGGFQDEPQDVYGPPPTEYQEEPQDVYGPPPTDEEPVVE